MNCETKRGNIRYNIIKHGKVNRNLNLGACLWETDCSAELTVRLKLYQKINLGNTSGGKI